MNRLRSFIRRDSRLTRAQEAALDTIWPRVGIRMDRGLVDWPSVFGREAPTLLEIGFGMGQSLLAAAIAYPDKNFVGIETHLPGIGAILQGIAKAGITNLKLCYGDAIDVLEKMVPPASLAGMQLFFPDPWQKRKHHARRLIQPDFLQKAHHALAPNGELHLATDWEDYAQHMMRVLSALPQWRNQAGVAQFADRSCYRPVISKFEARAAREGRRVFELQFAKQ